MTTAQMEKKIQKLEIENKALIEDNKKLDGVLEEKEIEIKELQKKLIKKSEEYISALIRAEKFENELYYLDKNPVKAIEKFVDLLPIESRLDVLPKIVAVNLKTLRELNEKRKNDFNYFNNIQLNTEQFILRMSEGSVGVRP